MVPSGPFREQDSRVRAPPIASLASEPLRAGLEWMACMCSPWLALAPRGDGHPVLVLPGLFADDVHTALLRNFLRARGFDARPWQGGCNIGRWESLKEIVLPALCALNERSGQAVSIVGASMGGLYAREAARHEPGRVRCVVTLSSPVRGPHRANHIWPLYEFISGQRAEAASAPPPPVVPSTSIYTRCDGLLAWQPCVQADGPHTENVEVPGSHLGMAWHPMALYVIADRLAQPEGAWQRFGTTGTS